MGDWAVGFIVVTVCNLDGIRHSINVVGLLG